MNATTQEAPASHQGLKENTEPAEPRIVPDGQSANHLDRIPSSASGVPESRVGVRPRLVSSPAGGFEVDLAEVSDEARVILEELRSFAAAVSRIMFHPDLDVPGRQAALLRLREGARASSWPEGACRAIERAVFECIFGRGREDWYLEASIEEAVVREHGASVEGVAS